MNKKILKLIIITLCFLSALIISSIISLSIGAADISFKTVLDSIKKGSMSFDLSIILKLRLPRILLGLAVGGALSVSGAILQGIFRNPLVEPYTLGISGGAGLGVCFCLMFDLDKILGSYSIPVSGFIGASAVIMFIYFISFNSKILRIKDMLLTGVMVSFISSSLMMLFMAVSKTENLHGIIYWTMGSLEEPKWALIVFTLILTLAGLVLSFLFSRNLNVLSLGESEAMHLGINTERTKIILFVITSLLTGVCVSIAGIIGFVGLIVPHFIRMFFGNDYRIILITSFLGGGSFLILCDTVARTIISPLELPVGVVTGIIGGILFVYALSRRQINL